MSDRGVRPSLLRSGQLSQSARLGVTTYDLQLWKVITPSSELRFLYSMERVKNRFICLRRIIDVRPRC